MSKNLFIGVIGTALFLNGCTMAPKYLRPQAPVSAEWPKGAAYPDLRAASGEPMPWELDWRNFFTDEQLRQVIETALANNRDLRLAALNVEKMRALYNIQREELYPTVYGTGSGGKQRASADLAAGGESRTTERYDVNFGVLSWEIDFFGRIRSLKDEALETYLGTKEARRSTQILLVSSVANAYMALAADREALALAENTLKTQRSALELVQRQYDLGIATELDLRRAQIPVAAARGDIARYTQRTAQTENALRLLVGSPVDAELLPAELGPISRPAAITPGLSSEALLRRPDIISAEHQLKGAYARIGAARAAFFPRISLTTTIGTASDELSRLFASGTGTWSYGPEIAMPIFDARTWSAHRVSKVEREIALAHYEKAIQNAFREVADALAVRGTVDQELAAQTSLVEALTETHRLAFLRFEKGIDSYLGVLDSQRTLYDAQQVLVSLRLAQFTSHVKLYAVLGGGWTGEAVGQAETK
jgi:multidrug efflux system outer membrane protein